MRTLIHACLVLGVAFLFSCGDGGELPGANPGGRNFVAETERFRLFLKQNKLNFSELSSGKNFIGGSLNCSAQSRMEIADYEYNLVSAGCNYVPSPLPDNNSSRFWMLGAATLPSGYIMFLEIYFLNTGIPATGTYKPYWMCTWGFCYSYPSVTAYIVNPISNDIVNALALQFSSLEVINSNGVVEVSFDGVFYNYGSQELLPGSGRLLCCN